MTFRVIEGGGRPAALTPGSVEEARAQIVDRVAAAIWAFQDEYPDPIYATWAEMKRLSAVDPSRAARVRVTIAQARAAIGALRPADEIDDSDTEVAAGAWEASTIGMAPSACLCGVQGWIDEVLK